MRDGLYKVQFQTPLGAGAGIVTLRDGKLGGGDSALYYVGTYTETGNQFSADVLVDRHTPGPQSVLGTDKAQLILTGTSDGDKAQMNGTSPQAPSVRFTADLVRIAD